MCDLHLVEGQCVTFILRTPPDCNKGETGKSKANDAKAKREMDIKLGKAAEDLGISVDRAYSLSISIQIVSSLRGAVIMMPLFRLLFRRGTKTFII